MLELLAFGESIGGVAAMEFEDVVVVIGLTLTGEFLFLPAVNDDDDDGDDDA